MKNAPNLELSLLARQWGASALPFGELTSDAWLDTPQTQRARALLDQTASLRSVMLLAGPAYSGAIRTPIPILSGQDSG